MGKEKDELKKGIWPLISLAVLVLLLPPARAKADELGDLKNQLSELQHRITQLEQQQKQKEASLTKKIDELAKQKTAPAKLPESLAWAEKVKISGDLRYRHDHMDEQDSTGDWATGRDRDRIRARVKLEAAVNDDWDAIFRIASGNDESPISTNQDLTKGFSKKNIWLDQAYFDWHPAAVNGLNVLGGKMANPFYRVGKNELIWDSDLNPEGLAAQISRPLSSIDRLFFNGGGFWVNENSSSADTSLWGAQTYIKHDLADSDYLLGGATYLDYGNLKGHADLKSTWGSSNFFGNTSTGGVYASDYNILEAFGEYGFKCSGMPMALFGSWVRNLVASTSEDTGWLVGARLNKAKDPGSWEFGYDYRELDADAIVGGFTESDFVESQTNSKGHRFVFAYQWARNIQSKLTYYQAENTASSSRNLDHRRLLADLVLKF
jgi:Putative porin